MKRGVDSGLEAAKMRSKRAASARLRSGALELPQGALTTMMQSCNTAAKNNLAGVAKHLTNW